MNLWTLKVSTVRGASLGFLFNDENQARRNYDMLRNAKLSIELAEARGVAPSSTKVDVQDNYGNVALIDTSEALYIWLTDMAGELEGQKEMQMLQAHAQANLNRRVAADPLLKGNVVPGAQIPQLIKTN